MATQDAQMLKGALSILLLELVRRHEDYGYALVVRLRSFGFTDLGEGSVYPALTRLEAAGLLASHLVRSDTGPARKYYSLTAAGEIELRRGVAAWRDLSGAVDLALTSYDLTSDLASGTPGHSRSTP